MNLYSYRNRRILNPNCFGPSKKQKTVIKTSIINGYDFTLGNKLHCYMYNTFVQHRNYFLLCTTL